MNPMMRVSEQWLEGFVKAAEGAGFSREQIPALLKVAQLRQVEREHPEAFEAGVASVMEKDALLGQRAFWASRKAAGVAGAAGAAGATAAKRMWPKILAWLGLGGAAAVGGKSMVEGGVDKLTQYSQLSDMNKYREQYAKQKTMKDLVGALPGMGGAGGDSAPSPYGYGRY